MTTVLFIRHGQSECNAAKLFAGRIDAKLTDLGKRQAQSVVTALQSFPISRIYSSPLSRAVETAKPTADFFGLDVILEPGLFEIAAGEWEGLSFTEIEKRYPEEYAHLTGDRSLLQPPGGESMRALYDRVIFCVERLVKENEGKCIALFSHAMPLKSLLCHWQNLPFSEIGNIPSSSNASVTVVEYDENGNFRLIQKADASHLETTTSLPLGL